MRRERAIAVLQEAFDRISQLKPAPSIQGIYAFGSLPRNVKKSVGDVDLVIVADMKPMMDFGKKLVGFLIQKQTETQWSVRKMLFEKYHELYRERQQSVGVKEREKWPPLGDFVCKEPMRSLLESHGVIPEWLACFTWNEIFNWSRYGMPNFALITSERLMQRMLFGFRRGFNVAYVGGSLEEAMHHLVTDRLARIWSPERTSVAQNLMLDPKAWREMLAKEHANMWGQLQYANTKNAILQRLCSHYLSILQRRVKGGKDPAEVLNSPIKLGRDRWLSLIELAGKESLEAERER